MSTHSANGMKGVTRTMSPPRGIRRALLATAAAALALTLAACTGANDGIAADYREGSNKGYVAGEFSTTEYSAHESQPVTFSGTLDDGSTLSSDELRGSVVVLNFWYASCAPCRAEAPVLEEVAQSYAGKNVRMFGVNTYDQAPTARSFAKTYSVSYPSFIDVDDKTVTRAFAQYVPLAATPVTIVLDEEGRVRARIISQLKDASILQTLVNDQLGPQATP
jgi:thiol-disulfide isomerase/thioredoxin